MSSDGDPGEFDPAQAGKQQADPSSMSQNQQQSDTMDVQSEKNGQAPGVAINGFGGLYPRMTDVDTATVLSLRNNAITAYRVNISSLECEKRDGTSCEDLEYNCAGHQVCDHLAAAIYQAPRTPDVDLKALDGAISTLSMAKDAAESAQNTADSLRAARNAHAQETAAAANENNSRPTKEELEPEPDITAEEAAEELQEAFDEQADGMQALAHDGVVWPNNTPNAPDWTFEAFIKNKEQIEWDNDGRYDHPTVGPNDYELENYIAPSDVESYINEVLE
jgi:hypothetical protein